MSQYHTRQKSRDAEQTVSSSSSSTATSLFSSSRDKNRHEASSSSSSSSSPTSLFSSSSKRSIDLIDEEAGGVIPSLHIQPFGSVGDNSWFNSNQLQLACEYLTDHFDNVTIFSPFVNNSTTSVLPMRLPHSVIHIQPSPCYT